MTEDDLAELSADEPSALHERVDVPGISQGRQSKVDVLEFRFPVAKVDPVAKVETTRVVWKRMGAGKHLTEDEARKLHERLRPYRRSLRTFGWNIPKLFQTRLLDTPVDEWQVVSFESFISGGDGDHLVADPNQPNYRKWHLLRSAIETLAEYPGEAITRQVVAGREATKLPHGLDLKLANLVMSPDEILYFVDLFGPKELDEEGNWLTYTPKLESISEENLMAVTATREGAVLRLFRLAEKTWIQSGSITQEELRQSLEDVLTQSGIPDRERDFILAEVDQDYPWLNELYSELNV